MNPNQRHVMPASYPGATGYFRQRSAEIRYRVRLACESFPRGLLGITPRYREVAERSIED
jgi:hypothetical protein